MTVLPGLIVSIVIGPLKDRRLDRYLTCRHENDRRSSLAIYLSGWFSPQFTLLSPGNSRSSSPLLKIFHPF